MATEQKVFEIIQAAGFEPLKDRGIIVKYAPGNLSEKIADFFSMEFYVLQLCREELGWKPTTTYTVIKRLSQRGVLKNENSVVTSLVSKDQAQASEIDELVEKRFEGSLPAFIAAFTKHRRMTESEINDIRKMIDDYGKENVHEPD